MIDVSGLAVGVHVIDVSIMQNYTNGFYPNLGHRIAKVTLNS